MFGEQPPSELNLSPLLARKQDQSWCDSTLPELLPDLPLPWVLIQAHINAGLNQAPGPTHSRFRRSPMAQPVAGRHPPQALGFMSELPFCFFSVLKQGQCSFTGSCFPETDRSRCLYVDSPSPPPVMGTRIKFLSKTDLQPSFIFTQ